MRPTGSWSVSPLGAHLPRLAADDVDIVGSSLHTPVKIRPESKRVLYTTARRVSVKHQPPGGSP